MICTISFIIFYICVNGKNMRFFFLVFSSFLCLVSAVLGSQLFSIRFYIFLPEEFLYFLNPWVVVKAKIRDQCLLRSSSCFFVGTQRDFCIIRLGAKTSMMLEDAIGINSQFFKLLPTPELFPYLEIQKQSKHIQYITRINQWYERRNKHFFNIVSI